MKEIEVKILEIDVNKVRDKLSQMGAEKTYDGEIYTAFLEHPDGKFREKGNTLRIRKIGNRVELCLKGAQEQSSFKIREETEVIVSSFEGAIKLFQSLGFRISQETGKRRESYRIGSTKFDIDAYPDIPTFLEIEAPTEKEILRAMEKLGYRREEANNWSYGELKDYYQKKRETEKKKERKK